MRVWRRSPEVAELNRATMPTAGRGGNSRVRWSVDASSPSTDHGSEGTCAVKSGGADAASTVPLLGGAHVCDSSLSETFENHFYDSLSPFYRIYFK